jgi:glycine cleavage system H protein
MDFPEGYRYTKEHEWVKESGDVVIVGITAFAQAELGELVFVDLPAVGKQVVAHGTMCVVESTKAASDVYAPLAGVVVEVNQALAADPGLINKDPYGAGWIVKLSGVTPAAVAELMTAAAYKQHLGV